MSGSITRSYQIDCVVVCVFRAIGHTGEREFSLGACTFSNYAFLGAISLASVDIVVEVL